MPIETVLIANRGEIAVRVIRGCRALGLATVAVHSAADADAMHVEMADGAVDLGGELAAESYLDHGKILAAAADSGADAIHPGYGFLSENAAFAEEVVSGGLTWIGPPPAAIAAMGDKVAARAEAAEAGVAGVPGSPGPIESPEQVLEFAAVHGWPLVIKASAGGGGRGMRVVAAAPEVEAALEGARREALASFGDDRVYVERYLAWPRHVEVQVLADAEGTVLALGERDCSIQRRHQKLVEEAPAPALSDALRAGLAEAATAIARRIGYRGAGTVEFLVEGDDFFFLEMNTRLQVEHPVTEAVFGVDLVAEQLRIAAGEPLGAGVLEARRHGHAIECRINAEDPAGGRFLPSPGRISRLETPSGPGVRFDGGYRSGDEVSPFYDNLIGKLVVWAPDRAAAIRGMLAALAELRVEGPATTASACRVVLSSPDFAAVAHATPWLERDVELPEAPQPASTEPDAPPSRVAWVNGRRYWLAPPLGGRGADDEAVSPSPADGAPAATEERRPPRRQAATDGTVLAPMQGTVIKVAAAAGELVAAGQVICVLEAMKMENEMTAPCDGVVAELRVVQGQGVAAGEALFAVEPTGEGETEEEA